jgi:pilus assembly protein CpaE
VVRTSWVCGPTSRNIIGAVVQLAAGTAPLRFATDRLALDRKKTAAANRQRGRSLAFLSVKGGCGATTVACHVAAEIDRLTGQDVLLADMDMDSGMVGFLMKAKGQYSIVDAAQNVHRLDLSYWSALVSSHKQGKLEVITAPPLAGLRNGLSGESFHQVFQFLRGNYDWVVADLGRSLDQINFAVLDVVDEIYLVSTFDLPALHLGKQVIQRLLEAGFGRNQLRLILNRAPKRPDFSSGEVQKALGLPVFDMLPNDYPELYQAYSEGNLLPNTSELAKSLAGLASKITGVQPREKAKQKSALSLFQF